MCALFVLAALLLPAGIAVAAYDVFVIPNFKLRQRLGITNHRFGTEFDAAEEHKFLIFCFMLIWPFALPIALCLLAMLGSYRFAHSSMKKIAKKMNLPVKN